MQEKNFLLSVSNTLRCQKKGNIRSLDEAFDAISRIKMYSGVQKVCANTIINLVKQ
ncbi:hypothetical protein CWI39_1483p0010 [Hamiltosporidium magnivora]|uniref:Uncharacterized protein n=1 Tax=Hamiltosporidium magnivora TaxID=148818 RepID=A0A4Q9L1Y5_9MICR|nr:hypothetical protein CWI39_1483p0010 [Hamiltosporidium magnivora]